MAGKPVVFDDTCYFMACRSQEEAECLAQLLNSRPAREFYNSLVFWDAKRPVTIEILRQLNLAAVARQLGLGAVRVRRLAPDHPEGVLHPDYRRRWRHGFVREERNGVEVCRTWLYPAANRGLWGRAANYASFAFSAAVVGPWVAPANGVVIATSPQLLVGMAGYVAARARRMPFVFEVRDLWPQSLEAVGQTRR